MALETTTTTMTTSGPLLLVISQTLTIILVPPAQAGISSTLMPEGVNSVFLAFWSNMCDEHFFVKVVDRGDQTFEYCSFTHSTLVKH